MLTTSWLLALVGMVCTLAGALNIRHSAASEVASSCTPMNPEFNPGFPPASSGGKPRL